MRKPQGYATIVGELAHDTPTIVEHKVRHKEAEIDTFTCNHCCKITHVLPKMDAADMGGLCKQCMQLICSRCVDKGVCTPWEKQMDEIANRQIARRSYGL